MITQPEKATLQAVQETLEGQGWLIPTKLSAPQQHASVISRPALLDRLDAGLDRRLSLLIASAGFGKTTLAAQWRRRLLSEGVQVAWVTLDEDDSEVTQFLSYLMAALGKAGVDLGPLLNAASCGLSEVPVSSAVAALVSCVASQDDKLVLILDDYHRLRSGPVADVMNGLIANMTANMHVMIISRERPGIHLGGLKARGEINELDTRDLRLSVAQARQLLPAVLGHEEVKFLTDGTEGWPTALQLVRVWLAERSERRSEIRSFSGRTSEVADYLAEQVLSDLSTELQEFLLKTSVLERFNGDLANAVCGREDCWQLLEHLTQLNSFLVADDDRRWYRYHHLFAEFLRDRLSRSALGDTAPLHRSASAWYAANGHLGEAVRHARLAGDLDVAASLIEEAGAWELVFLKGVGQVRNLLKNFDGALHGFPRLQLCQAYVLIREGDLGAADEVFGQVQQLLGREENGWAADQALSRDADMVGLMLAGYQDRLLDEAQARYLKDVLARTPAEDHRALGAIFCARCINSLGRGDFKDTRYAARQAARHMRMVDSALGETYSEFHLGVAKLFSGDLDGAKSTYERALARAVEHFGNDSGPKAIADVLMAQVLYQKNELEAAAEHLNAGLLYVEDYDGWLDIYAAGYQTAIALALARNQFDAAHDLLERGLNTARNRGLKRLADIMNGENVRVCLHAGDLAVAERLSERLESQFQIGAWRDSPSIWRQHYAMGIALAENAAARGRSSDALRTLQDVEQCVRSLSCVYLLVETLASKALAAHRGGRTAEAMDALHEAIALAAPRGLQHPILDRGYGMEALIRRFLTKAADAEWSIRDFAHKLIDGAATRSAGAYGLSASVEFTERELEVLLHLSRGYRNKVIARALGISENTVKYHLKNIYAKLGVDRRTRAIAVARDRSMIR